MFWLHGRFSCGAFLYLRAIESYKASGIEVTDHFREVTKMIETGKGLYVNAICLLFDWNNLSVRDMLGKRGIKSE